MFSHCRRKGKRLRLKLTLTYRQISVNFTEMYVFEKILHVHRRNSEVYFIFGTASMKLSNVLIVLVPVHEHSDSNLKQRNTPKTATFGQLSSSPFH